MQQTVCLHNSAYGLLVALPNRKGYDAKWQVAKPIDWQAVLWSKVDKDQDGCWRVRGIGVNRAGHVHIILPNGWRVLAHRLSWWLANGKIPKGQSICHTCDVPRCVNPAHLFLGSTRDNMHDAIQKGRKNCFGIQKLNADQVRQIRALAAQGGMTHKEIGQRFGVARNTVSQIVNRKNWKHVS